MTVAKMVLKENMLKLKAKLQKGNTNIRAKGYTSDARAISIPTLKAKCMRSVTHILQAEFMDKSKSVVTKAADVNS